MKLALGMIARNEEEWLAKTLPVYADQFDFKFAVDTGSVDGTVGLLKERKFAVKTMQWKNNFSLARNECINFAESKGIDCMLMLDADEAIFPNQVDNLVSEFQKTDQPLGFKRINLAGKNMDQWEKKTFPDTQPRGVHLKKHRYVFKLHEWIACRETMNTLNLKPTTAPIIYHYGNCKDVKSRWLIHHNYHRIQNGEPFLTRIPDQFRDMPEEEFKSAVNFKMDAEPFNDNHPLK